MVFINRSPLTHSRLLHPSMRRRGGGGGLVASYAFETSNSQSGNNQNYTFDGTTLGDNSKDRLLAVFACCWPNDANREITGISIDGTAGDLAGATALQTEQRANVSCYQRFLSASGDTGDAVGPIAVTTGGVQLRCSMFVYEMFDLNSTTPFSVAAETKQVSSGDAFVEATVDRPTDGIAIAASHIDRGSSSMACTVGGGSVAVDAETAPDTCKAGAVSQQGAANAALAMRATYNEADFAMGILGVVWR